MRTQRKIQTIQTSYNMQDKKQSKTLDRDHFWSENGTVFEKTIQFIFKISPVLVQEQASSIVCASNREGRLSKRCFSPRHFTISNGRTSSCDGAHSSLWDYYLTENMRSLPP